MSRILCIDYGRKRCGIAVTDPLQIIAGGLDTVRTHEIEQWVLNYVAQEQVETIVLGLPKQLNGQDSESMRYIKPFVERLGKKLPKDINIVMHDERFTSAIAQRAMIDGGMPKGKRQVKGNVDRIAATIILNDYLEARKFKS